MRNGSHDIPRFRNADMKGEMMIFSPGRIWTVEGVLCRHSQALSEAPDTRDE